MVGEAGAIGDMMTGALAARAVESRAGEAQHDAHEHGETCLNCHTALVGDYCHACGQHAHLHRSVGAIWHDIAHGVLHLEGKTWRTLPMLAWRPGELTRRYIDGERARFVSPMALFLFSVFLMFAVIQGLGASLHTPELSAEQRREATSRLTAEIAADQAAIRLAEAERDQLAARGASTEAVRNRLRALHAEVTAKSTAKAVAASTSAVEIGLDNGLPENIQTGWKRLDKGIAKARANPNLALYKVQTNAYKFSWALIPISVPFVWLMFAWRRRFHVYDHAVFVTYSLSFMTLMAVVLTTVWTMGLPADFAWLIGMLAAPIHMYRQLRGTYRLRRFKALLRTIALVTFANIAISIFFLLLLALGALG